MNNILNEPPNDLFEDSFWSYLSKYNIFSHGEIDSAIISAHDKCGGQEGDEPSIDYGIQLCNENENLSRKDVWYEWKI